MAKITITLVPIVVVLAVMLTARTVWASKEYAEAQCKLTPKPEACLKIVSPSAAEIHESFYELVKVALFNSVSILKETEQMFKQIVHESMFTDQHEAVQTCVDSTEAAGTNLDSAALFLGKIDPNVTRFELAGPMGHKVAAEFSLAERNIAACPPLLAKLDANKLLAQKDFLNDSVETIQVLKSLLSS